MKKVVFTFVLGIVSISPAYTLNWEDISPYLLPDGETKNIADKIFRKRLFTAFYKQRRRAPRAFSRAGFVSLKDDFRVSINPKLPYFVFKIARHKHCPDNPTHKSEVIERVRRAALLRQRIAALGLKNIHVPLKYLYHPPGLRSKVTDKNFVCFSEAFDLLPPEQNKIALWHLPHETVQEVITLIRDIEFLDVHEDNLYVLPDGKSVVFIDTELITQSPYFNTTQECIDWFCSMVAVAANCP